MRIDLFRPILNIGRKAGASSWSARSLRVESLENRELLDASGGCDSTPPSPTGVEENPCDVATQERVETSVDLGNLVGNAGENSNEVLTIDAPASLELDEYNVDTEELSMLWTKVEGADGYRIEYTTNGGKSWKLGAVVGADVTSRTASKVRSNVEYVFRVQAFKGTYSSEWTYSDPFVYTETIPAAPRKFRLGKYDSVMGKLTMDWDKVANAEGYRVQYSIDGGSSWYSSETLIGVDSTSRTAWKVRMDREYQFRVCAYNEFGASEWTYSDKFHVNYDELENPSYVLIGEYDASNRTLAMSWDAVEGATGYEVQYSLDKGNTWRLAQKLYDGETSRLAKSVIPGTIYEFRVRAFNSIGISDWTYSKLYTPPALLTAPAFLQIDSYDPSTCRLGLSWGDVPDEDGYKIEYSTDGGTTWTVAFKTEADVTKGIAEGIKSNVSYMLHVRAYNETDVSPWTTTFFRYADWIESGV